MGLITQDKTLGPGRRCPQCPWPQQVLAGARPGPDSCCQPHVAGGHIQAPEAGGFLPDFLSGVCSAGRHQGCWQFSQAYPKNGISFIATSRALNRNVAWKMVPFQTECTELSVREAWHRREPGNEIHPGPFTWGQCLEILGALPNMPAADFTDPFQQLSCNPSTFPCHQGSLVPMPPTLFMTEPRPGPKTPSTLLKAKGCVLGSNTFYSL